MAVFQSNAEAIVRRSAQRLGKYTGGVNGAVTQLELIFGSSIRNQWLIKPLGAHITDCPPNRTHLYMPEVPLDPKKRRKMQLMRLTILKYPSMGTPGPCTAGEFTPV